MCGIELVSAQHAFGRRGEKSAPSLGPAAVEALPAAAVMPSAVHDQIAAAARAAFKERNGGEPRFEPFAPTIPPRVLDDEEAMRAYIGPNWGAYQALWERDHLRPGLRASLGLGPMLFGATWLIYRKRFLLGLVFVAAEATTAYFAPLFAILIGLMLRVVVGRYGKSLVLKAGAGEIAREQSSGAATGLRLRRLRRAGGVTLWLPILLMLGEAWLALHQAQGLKAPDFEAAGILGAVQNALP